MKRILSFDGGGIRGLFSLRVLQRLQARAGGIVHRADLLAGTSTGGLIALGLAGGYSVGEILSVYLVKARSIFKDDLLDDIQDLGGISGAEYDLKGLHDVVYELFGERKLGDLKKRVLIAAFDLDDGEDNPWGGVRTWRPKFFDSHDPEDQTARIVDVALATSAAPTYFPSHRGYIDGGVVAANPVMAAIAQLASEGVRVEDMEALSFGTGLMPQFVSGMTHDWGYAEWATRLPSLMLDGQVGFADFQARALLGGQYARLDAVLTRAISMDATDPRELELLLSFAERVKLDQALEVAEASGWGAPREAAASA